MKIGYDGKYLSGSGSKGADSGNGVHAREMLRHLMLVDSENQYTVYLLDKNRLFAHNQNFNFKILRWMSQNSYFRNLLSYPIELISNPVDIFLAFSTVPSVVRGKVVLFLFDIFWIVHPEWLPKRYQLPISIMTKRSVKRADKIITISYFSKSEIIKHLGVSEEKIRVIYCGLCEHFSEKFTKEKIEIVKKKYSINGKYILSVNDIHPRKNMERLVDAFCYLKAHHKIEHKLVLVGRIRWKASVLLKKIASAKHKNDIVLAGYIPSDDVGPLYQGATLFAYPSFYEGFGLPLLEAMASGTPVAIGNRSSPPEVAGNAAVQFNPFDIHSMSEVIYELLEDTSLQKKLVERGQERIKEFSWVDAAQKLLKVYKEVFQDG